MNALLIIVGLLFAATNVVQAQRVEERTRSRTPDGPFADVVFGLHAGAPHKVALALGVAYVVADSPRSRKGYALIAEGGVSAGRLSVAAVEYELAASGFQTRASVLRTWGSPWKIAANQTFIGPEVRFSPTLLTIGVGYYWRVAGNAPGDARFFAPTVGILF